MAQLNPKPTFHERHASALADEQGIQWVIDRQLEADQSSLRPAQPRTPRPDEVLPSIEVKEEPEEEEEASDREYEVEAVTASRRDDKEEEDEASDQLYEAIPSIKVEGESEEEEDEASEQEYEVEAITAFRRDDEDPHTILLKTKWRGYPPAQSTWETELDLVSEGAAEAVYAFWAGRPGGRDAALALHRHRRHYVAYRILRRVEATAKKPSVLVQWLGYDEAAATVESESRMRTLAPQLLRDFLKAEAAAAAGEAEGREGVGA